MQLQAEDRAALRELVDGGRQAALGTLADGAPFVSMVLYAVERPPGAAPAFLIYVSRLAPHTRQLLADPRASLMVVGRDDGAGDPQALPRVTVQALAAAIPPESPGHAAARAAYLARLPQQEYLFGFGDFALVRLTPTSARYTGGFARAFGLSAEQLAEALA